MPSPTRRRLLALLAGSPSVLGGCSGTDERTESTPTLTPAPALSPTYRPPRPPADCDPYSYPTPEVGDTAVRPRAYPSPPESVDTESAAAFAERFETAYRHNEFLAGTDADRLASLLVDSRAVVNEPLGDGRLVGVEGMLRSEPTTPEPGSDESAVPYADLPFTAWYYLTDSFGRRAGEAAEDLLSRPAPSLRSAEVVYCGE